MNNSIRNLEPKELWNHFSDLNAIPRASKKEEKIIEFIVNFGNALGLETHKDETGNIIIKKAATPGMEGREIVALQSHLDMVHQKNAGTTFDFSTQGINILTDGDWVKANGTTLGADNGIGVASIMTILASKEIAHPALEALFTIDEETGMTGALGLKGGLLNAKILLNLDTEDDRELTIGCAGGVDVTATGTYQYDEAGKDAIAFRISLNGLTGGHSGMDIHRGRANANKLMNRLLYHITNHFAGRISLVDGGSLRNAIPRESFADVVIPDSRATELLNFLQTQNEVFKNEYHSTDPHLMISGEKISVPANVMAMKDQHAMLCTLYTCPNGIFRMSPEIEGLVNTSNNLARVLIKEGVYSFQCLTRSAVETEKADLAQAIKCCFELIGASVAFSGSYPGWTPKPEAPIVKLMSELYKERYNENPLVDACHAGLECGILGTNYPDIQMISFGPNIQGAHSPDEKVQISSVQKYWGFLLEILKRIPERNHYVT